MTPVPASLIVSASGFHAFPGLFSRTVVVLVTVFLFSGCYYFSLEQPCVHMANCSMTSELEGIWKSTKGGRYLQIDSASEGGYEIREVIFDRRGAESSERLVVAFPYELGNRRILVAVDAGSIHYAEVDESTIEMSRNSEGKWAYLLYSLDLDGKILDLAMLNVEQSANNLEGIREALANIHKRGISDALGRWEKTDLEFLPVRQRPSDLIAFENPTL